MAGYTDFCVGVVRDVQVMIPIDIITSAGSRKMKRKDYEWQRLISSTGQRTFLSPENFVKIIKMERAVEEMQRNLILKVKADILQSKGRELERNMTQHVNNLAD